eukprot:7771031-Alexandrium_andersonii.AAC.1
MSGERQKAKDLRWRVQGSGKRPKTYVGGSGERQKTSGGKASAADTKDLRWRVRRGGRIPPVAGPRQQKAQRRLTLA